MVYLGKNPNIIINLILSINPDLNPIGMRKCLLLHGSLMRSLLFIALIIASLGAEAQKKKPKTPPTPPTQVKSDSVKTPKPAQPANKSNIKAYKDIISAQAKTDSGLWITHIVDENFYFEIPDSVLEREILLVSRIKSTVENLNFGGAGMESRPEQVIRWQKNGNRILMRSVSHNNVADPDLPIYQSVRNNNFEPIVMSFEIKAFSKDTGAYVIDVKDLFTSDIDMIGPLSASQRKDFEIKSLDKTRSLITRMKSFPLNVEISHILTYNAGKAPANAVTGSMSLEMNQSMILLPRVPMKPRLHDQRVGFFSASQVDYGLDEQRAASRQFITRWRLEPKDMNAFARGELVEPAKPIVYYIDPATPEKWRPYLKQGIEDWQVAFEAAGFKRAIIAKDPPTLEEDPDWSPEDVRYSVIRYITTTIQNAQGPHVHDPRSGEIIESDILWYHNVMNLLRNWFFVQTAAVNPDARKVKFDDELMGQLIRFVAAHEVGHTLGFPHNMGSSWAYPVDSLRSAKFTQKMNTAPSIMDYARFNYVAQPEDKNVNLFPGIGVYDKYAVNWGYRPLPDAKSPEDEKETLNQWIKAHEGDPMYRYGRQMGNPLDPSSQTEDLGNNAMKASAYGIANLKRVLPNLITWTNEAGKDYDDLKELYDNVIGQYNRYMGHVRTYVGGVQEWYKTYDQSGAVYKHTEKPLQSEAVSFLNKNLFETPTWLINEDILRRVESAGMIERIRRVQTGTLTALFDASRMARLIENEAIKGKDAYSLMDLFNDTRKGIWSELDRGRSIDPYRRNLQRAYIDLMGNLMKEEQRAAPENAQNFTAYTPINVSQSDIRAVVRANLMTLNREIRLSITQFSDPLSRYHLDDTLERINQILNPNG